MLILFSVYSVGRVLSRHELNAILNATRPTTKKRKNTYIIKPTFLHRFKIIDKLTNCPVPVVSINGTPVKNAFASILLSGRAARQIAESESVSRTYTITEYLDKETGKPVVQIYPESMYVFDEYNDNYMQRLNHASRQDMQHQISLRVKLIKDFIEKNKLQQR